MKIEEAGSEREPQCLQPVQTRNVGYHMSIPTGFPLVDRPKQTYCSRVAVLCQITYLVWDLTLPGLGHTCGAGCLLLL